LPDPDPFDADALLRAGSFVELTTADGIAIDLRYATAANFTGRPVYGGFDRLILHRIAADKLRRAVSELAARSPGWRLLVFDGLRPNRIQQIFWDTVRGTPEQAYVGDPAQGSVHGFGLAVDVSLVDATGREVDMGTPFDDFTPRAEPRHESALLAAGELTTAQVDRRLLLRRVMEVAGFTPIPIEWWHFDALPPDEARTRFTLIR
jgi:zinc D-Ala-D-Ala dipeptidase